MLDTADLFLGGQGSGDADRTCFTLGTGFRSGRERCTIVECVDANLAPAVYKSHTCYNVAPGNVGWSDTYLMRSRSRKQ